MRFVGWTFCVLVFWIALAIPVSAQISSPQSVRLTMPISVTTPRGIVFDLQAADFRILIDKQPCSVQTVSHADIELAVGFVFDTTRSMQMRYPENGLRQAISAFMDNSDARNEYFVMEINESPRLLQDFTRDRNAVLAAVPQDRKGETDLYGGLAFALRKIQESPNRKALVVFSDGYDNKSKTKFEEMTRASAASDVMLVAVVEDPSLMSQKARSNTYLTPTNSEFVRYVELLGGLFVPVLSARADLNRITSGFADAAASLRQLYWTECEMAAPKSGWHDVKTEIIKPGLRNVTIAARQKTYRKK